MLSQNPFLQGNFAPVSEEQFHTRLKVSGKLPPALRGIYIQNGPNPQFPPVGNYHPFDGDGMLHAIYLDNGTASYRNRYIQTHAYQAEQAAGRPLWTGLLDPLQLQPPQGRIKNPANTSIIRHAGRTLALWEQGSPYEIDPSELATLGEYHFQGGLTHVMTAHPKCDPVSGELFVFGYQTMQAPFVHYTIFSAAGERLHHTSLDLPCGVMMHDFAITEDYAIFLELPYTFNIRHWRTKGALGGFDAALPARIGILPRYAAGEDVVWINIDPCFVFHIINAYQSDGEIIVDACRYHDLTMPVNPPPGHPVDYERLLRPVVRQPQSARWRINPDMRTAVQLPLMELALELPRINERFTGRPYRYAYLAELSTDSLPPVGTGYVKCDLEQRQVRVHSHGRGRFGGEAVFVADPDADPQLEDAGWLLGFVYDQASGRSDFVVVSALAPEQPPVAIVHLPLRVPYGIHGAWLPAS